MALVMVPLKQGRQMICLQGIATGSTRMERQMGHITWKYIQIHTFTSAGKHKYK